MLRFRDVAKFLAGLFTWEAIIHAALLGRDSQAKFFGWKVSRTYSMTQTIVATVAAGLMLWFGWRRWKADGTVVEKETILPEPRVEEQLRVG